MTASEIHRDDPPGGSSTGPRDRLFAPGLLSGKTALVTGGGTGIGYGISSCLARAGADVAIAARKLERLEEAAGRLEAEHGGRVLPLETDVREPERIRDTADRAAEELGGLHILVNNAAGNFYCPSEDLTPGGWSAVVETDLYGSFYAAQAACPHMEDAGWGRIVSISMTLHYRGWPKMAHATAAKAGVDALTRTLALEWADRGINVTAVAPGPVPTEGVREAFRDPGEETPDLFGDAGPAAAGYGREVVPAGRLGTPEDVGRMVTYLCSPGGDWITGAIFVVDGGENLAKVGRTPG
jgi:NAD(P)-dependent dehydrogenase (short-subunit alcohol dehydrogenase family)